MTTVLSSRSPRRTALAIAMVALFGLTGAATPAASPRAAPAPAAEFLRGMTVSCPGMGRIWGSPAMSEALDELVALGVRWVSIHPYAGVRRDGSVRYQPAAEASYLAAAVARARAAGVELFWKPHLAYWGSFEWRGAIDFGTDDAAWARFFRDYRAFIVDQARFAEQAGVALLAVGVELEATTDGHEAAWRRIVAEVRAVYSGTVTYAANWDRLDKVPFWDAMDWIGVQAYFPLSAAARPSRAELERGWEAPLAALRRLSQTHGGKPVLFAEIGYDLSPDAAREPWRTAGRGAVSDRAARALRRDLIEIALERLEREPTIRGMFWWKWMPGSGHRHDRHDRDFPMRHPDARDLLRRAWGAT